MTAVHQNLARYGPDVRAAGRAAILHVLQPAADNPLVRAILGGDGTGALLPFLTTRSGVVLDGATAVVREWATAELSHLDPANITAAAETIARLPISHVVLPSATPKRTAQILAEVQIRLLR